MTEKLKPSDISNALDGTKISRRAGIVMYYHHSGYRGYYIVNENIKDDERKYKVVIKGNMNDACREFNKTVSATLKHQI